MEEHKHKKEMSTPQAIVVAGLLITIAIFLTNSNYFKDTPNNKNKALSEQVGISKEKMDACIAGADKELITTNIVTSIERAMSHIPNNERGTPYSVVIGKDGVKTEIMGAQDYAKVKMIIDEAIAGKVSNEYKGNIQINEPGDYTLGKEDAIVTIIEYSDFECPYCKRFHNTMKKVMSEYEGQVKWTYRQLPLHQYSLDKSIAADCVGQMKGSEAYFKYADLLFGLLKTGDESINEQL